jgi:hypothetical protein
MDTKNVRKNFIRRIGLDHDPFESPVAEQELRRVQDIFYSYYSPPVLSSSQEELLNSLRRPQPSFLLGSPGSGKSTLRLTLEADCRTVLDGTLAISYIFGEDLETPLSHEEHGKRLAQAAIIDLTLATIEQFNPIHPPSTDQIDALQKLIPSGGRQLQRLLRVLLEKNTHPGVSATDPVWGISREWKIIGKAPVKYVGVSEKLGNFLKKLITQKEEAKTGWKQFWQVLRTAEIWGFKRFFILVDGVDARQRSPKAMMNLLASLLEEIRTMVNRHAYFKMFLPLELQKNIQNYLQTHRETLPFEVFFSIMEWDDTTMRRLLTQRFRAAMPQSGPRHMGLDSLSSPGFNLDEKLINIANRSPRRLMEITSDLIDIHLARDPHSLQFDQADWEICQKKWNLRTASNPVKKNNGGSRGTRMSL